MENPVEKIRALYGEQRFAETVDYVRRVIADPTPRGAQWEMIANGATSVSDRYAAVLAARRWISEDPDSLGAKIYYLNRLTNATMSDEAYDVVKALSISHCDNAMVWFMRGEIEAQLGKVDDALAHLRKAWEIDPLFIGAWQRIARLKDFKSDDPDIAIITDLPEKARSLAPDYRIAANYACAELFESLGDVDRAFFHFQAGANLSKEQISYDMDRQVGLMKNGLEIFSKEKLKELETIGDPDATPIFIVGLPRSGTTLVEQILSSHSAVKAAGETSALRVASWPLKDYSTASFKIFNDYGDDVKWRRMAQHYQSLLTELVGDAQFVTNKDIGSISSIGLIHVLFPKAKIIFCDRDARDAAWSCYKAYFGAPIPWASDFHDIGRFFASFRYTRRQWKERIDVTYFDAPYEQLVNNPDAYIRGLLDYCGLEQEEACFKFYENERAVTTASVTQVREPIYRSSIGSWKKYAKHLTPMLEATARYGLDAE